MCELVQVFQETDAKIRLNVQKFIRENTLWEPEGRSQESHQTNTKVWPRIKERKKEGRKVVQKYPRQLNSSEGLARLLGSPLAEIYCEKNTGPPRIRPTLVSLVCAVFFSGTSPGRGDLSANLVMASRAQQLETLVSYSFCNWSSEAHSKGHYNIPIIKRMRSIFLVLHFQNLSLSVLA